MDLNQFQRAEILNQNTTEKRSIMLGRFKEKQGEAILIVTAEVPDKVSFQNVTSVFQNDIYSRFEGKMMNGVSIQAIYPITQKHKEKYKKKTYILKEQTPEMYENTKQQLLKKQLNHINWVTNIIQGKAEAQRVLFRNPHFIILPDFKFVNLEDTDSLHLLAIFTDQSLCSLRDLRETHIKLLEEVRADIDALLTNKFKMLKNSYRLFFHYPPTFYRLHIHIVSLRSDSSGALIDRAHSLQTVIANLKLNGEYYSKINLLIHKEAQG